MKRILFVDDEPGVLEGIRDLLRPYRRKWDMVFVVSGEAALEELERAPFDIIVSDMRMPQMDGATLLKAVQTRFPRVVRFILSGYSEFEASLSSVSVAHQFLSKPCDPEQFRGALERACSLRDLLNDEALMATIGEISSLPSVPAAYRAITRALENPDAKVKEIAAIIEQNSVICAKILQVANSAFFAPAHRVSSIAEAVSYLGITMLKTLVLSFESFGHFRMGMRVPEAEIDRLQRRALLTARLCRQIAGPIGAEEAFTSGLLHDIGYLIIAYYLPDRYKRLLAASQAEGRPFHELEREFYGITHAELGAYLLGLWGLPNPIVEAVAHHHEPWRVPHAAFGSLDALYVADVLILEQEGSGATPPLNVLHLETLAAPAEVHHWRELARELMTHD